MEYPVLLSCALRVRRCHVGGAGGSVRYHPATPGWARNRVGRAPPPGPYATQRDRTHIPYPFRLPATGEDQRVV